MIVDFEKLPDHARLWAFASDRELNTDEQTQIGEFVSEFLGGWAAHGAALTAGFDLLHNRFLLVGVNQDDTAPSGCSIDAMTRFLRQVREQSGLDFLDAPHCCYLSEGTVQAVDRATFRALAQEGKVDGDTIVFDLTVPTIGDVRAGKFETAAAGTWYGKAFPLAEPAA